MKELSYGLTVTVELPVDEARTLIVDALNREGFGILTEIDVQRTIKEKTGVDMERYLILGACNPELAHAALVNDADAGLLLPCNVVIRQNGDESVVSIVDPVAISEVAGGNGLREIGRIVRQKIEAALARFADQSTE